MIFIKEETREKIRTDIFLPSDMMYLNIQAGHIEKLHCII